MRSWPPGRPRRISSSVPTWSSRAVELEGGLVRRILGDGVLAMPLWGVGPSVARHVEALPGARPFELATAFQQAIDAGEEIAGIEVGSTRGLTTPFDLLEHNFPYLRSL